MPLKDKNPFQLHPSSLSKEVFIKGFVDGDIFWYKEGKYFLNGEKIIPWDKFNVSKYNFTKEDTIKYNSGIMWIRIQGKWIQVDFPVMNTVSSPIPVEYTILDYLAGPVNYDIVSTPTGFRQFDSLLLSVIGASKLTNIGMDSFSECGALESVNIPSVTSIGDYAFSRCNSLTNINIPEVVSIGIGTFFQCNSSTAFLGPKINSIGDYAFYDSSFSTIELPLVASLGDWGFQSCDATTIIVPSASIISTGSFDSCYNLIELDISSAVVIGDYACFTCYDMEDLPLPSVTNIGNHAFDRCRGFRNFSGPSVIVVGDYAFWSCELVSVSLPATSTIGEYAFSECRQLTTVSMSQIRFIGARAFWLCGEMTSFSMPSVETIGEYAFAGCVQFTTLVAPLCTSIGLRAFNSSTISSVYLAGSPTIEGEVFYSCAMLTHIYLNTPILSSDSLYGSYITTIHIPTSIPAGWVVGSGQTISGKSGITVVADWII